YVDQRVRHDRHLLEELPEAGLQRRLRRLPQLPLHCRHRHELTMGADSPNLQPKRAQRGFGMIEILVGVLIGLLAVIVMYQVFTVAEGFKRNTTAVGEAQQSGLFSMFFLGLDLANAGSGLVPESLNLASCSDPGGAMPTRFAQSYRPLPV